MDALLIGLLLALLAVTQTALSASALAESGRPDQRELATFPQTESHAAHAQTNSEAPCFNHEPGSQCTPCQHCSTPVTEVPQPPELARTKPLELRPPDVTQNFPATVFKPPRRAL